MGFIILAIGGYFLYLSTKTETDADRMQYNNMHLGGGFDEQRARERQVEWKRFWSKCYAWIGVLLSFAGMIGVLYFFMAKH